MSGKKVDVSRRSFLQRSALLVSALGVGASVQSGLMDAIVRRAKKSYGSALAAGNVYIRQIDIAFRAGQDMKGLFGSRNLKVYDFADRMGSLNYRWSSARTGEYDTGNANKLYLAEVTGQGTLGANPLGVNHADKVAYIRTPGDGGHTSSWTVRGARGNGAVTVTKANAMRTQGVGAVDAVLWNPNVNVQNPGSISLTEVNDQNEFTELFKDKQLYFTREELMHLVGTFELNTANLLGDGALQKLDSIWKTSRPLPGQDDVFQIAHSGRAGSLFSVDLNPTIASPYMPTNMQTGSAFDANQALLDFAFGDQDYRFGGTHFGEAFFQLYRAMSHPGNLVLNATIQSNPGDQHGDTSGNDALTTRQGRFANTMTRAISTFMDYAANTPDLLNDPTGELGLTILDTSLIVLSSEFDRSIALSSDSGDRTPGAMALFGGIVNGGTYTDVEPRASASGTDFNGYAAGRVFGLDANGVPNQPVQGNMSMLPSDEDVYASVLKAQGYSDSDIGSQFPMAGSALSYLMDYSKFS